MYYSITILNNVGDVITKDYSYNLPSFSRYNHVEYYSELTKQKVILHNLSVVILEETGDLNKIISELKMTND